jgi:hypothetical protein
MTVGFARADVAGSWTGAGEAISAGSGAAPELCIATVTSPG